MSTGPIGQRKTIAELPIINEIDEGGQLAVFQAGATGRASAAALLRKVRGEAVPEQLNTLEKIAAALGNDENFLALLATLASPAFTGTPTAPTAPAGTNTAQLATTAFVRAAIAALLDAAPGTLDTLNELAAALGDDPNFATTITAQLAGKADAAATTSALAAKAPLVSPSLTGTPTAPTAAAGTNTTQIATTAFVQAMAALKANLASPSFTGTPTAPTAAPGTNTTQIATTAYVLAALAALVDAAPSTLDTLNELAAALGDDPNFATTVTNQIAALASGGIIKDAALPARLQEVAAVTADWNTALSSGFYRANTTAINGPVAATSYFGTVLNYGANNIYQEIVQVNPPGTGSSEPEVYARLCEAGTWGPWKLIRQTETQLDARYALAARAINVSGLASGGGNLTADRTIDVPIATQAEAQAGAVNNKAMTPLRVAEAIAAAGVGGSALTQYFESAPQAFSSPLTVAHGLAGKPRLVRVVAVCVTAQFGYAVGDEIDWAGYTIDGQPSPSVGRGVFAASDANSVYVQLVDWRVHTKGGSTSAAPNVLAAPNWQIIIRAWR